MIQVTAQMRVLLAVGATDLRRGIDGLARLCRKELCRDPFSGTVFVFCNRRRTTIKLLSYDGRGFWLCQMRLSSGRFRHWPEGDKPQSVEAHELAVLLSGGDPRAAKGAPPWRRVSVPA